MFGAVIGDIVGSVYEWNNIKTTDFPLFSKDCIFTDDTILTVAAADWVMNGGKPEDVLRRWGKKYVGENKFGKNSFGPGFQKWLENEDMGPYQANTNGCVMRVSPVPFLIRNRNTALQKAEELTNVTHNHPDSIRAVRAYVDVMLQAFSGETPENMRRMLEVNYGYDMSRSVEEIRRVSGKFIYTCNYSVPQAMICALEANSFEEALRNAVSLGGDSDTIACMSGAIAEARFGIPQDIGLNALKYIDRDICGILKNMYEFQSERMNMVLKNKGRKSR